MNDSKKVAFRDDVEGGGDGGEEGRGDEGGEDNEMPMPESTPPRTMGSSDDATASISRRRLAASLPANRKASFVDRRSQWPRSLSVRARDDHMTQLIQQRRESMRVLFPPEGEAAGKIDVEGGAGGLVLSKSTMEAHSEFVGRLKEFLHKLGDDVDAGLQNPAMEIRLQNVSYKVPALNEQEKKIQTIYNTSPVYKMKKFVQWLTKSKGDEPEEKELVTTVLSKVNLVLKPKCMYLVLGPPLSGKTSLLKAIAGLLPQGKFPSGYPEENYLTGQVLYNNLVCAGDGADESQRTLFQNLVAFVRQSDDHAPLLTVAETFLFSGECKDENIRKNKKGAAMDGKVGLTLEGLGLSHVQDTFVGNEQIRGVSGGQRRRVTLGEMFVFDTPLLCGDEISTGEFIVLPQQKALSKPSLSKTFLLMQINFHRARHCVHS